MVSSGGGEIGAAKLTGEVLDVVRRLPAVVEVMTGVKLMPSNGGGAAKKKLHE